MLHLGENMKQRINHCTTANIAILFPIIKEIINCATEKFWCFNSQN